MVAERSVNLRRFMVT